MINAHAQILYGRSKKQFDKLASSFKQDSKSESGNVVVHPQPRPVAFDPERFRADAEKQKKVP